MADKRESGVLASNEEFGKHNCSATSEQADAAAREEMAHMAEKTKVPRAASSANGKA